MEQDPLEDLEKRGPLTPAPAPSPRHAPRRDHPLMDAEAADAWLAWSRADFDDPTPQPPVRCTATLARDPESSWWLVTVAGIGITQARDPADAPRAAAELVAATLGVDPASVMVTVTVGVPDPEAVSGPDEMVGG